MSILRQIFDTLREYYAAKPDYLWWSENPVEVIIGTLRIFSCGILHELPRPVNPDLRDTRSLRTSV
jgi:hypothetical protein